MQPTVGKWLEGLPWWKKKLHSILCVLVGEITATEWVGYHRDTKNK